jgi:hypothetical protein
MKTDNQDQAISGSLKFNARVSQKKRDGSAIIILINSTDKAIGFRAKKYRAHLSAGIG